ncbi:hypothetical protein SAMN04488074_108256 [Lentzea albidocapillata subsp. violacea]|uniref:Uncharacterized protein n=1 Tax=Lentzea albidocapillata subsp. violacea TaxID=128104 RepID=A0A1G9GN52_9PSEU|nr:hypothetical protein [Lentzea albidocapillata]SDL01713.1 hypothetical protein SAMN04488074_108256 [Lentzea albidocapillata subsp. violacea]
MTAEPVPAAPMTGGHWVVSLALVVWLLIKGSRAAVLWIERHDGTQPTLEEHPVTDPRPRPLRTVATWVGLLTALVSWLVGSGLLTTGQADAITGTAAAVLALLGAFGVALAGERKVTPTLDPRDDAGRPLVPLDAD